VRFANTRSLRIAYLQDGPADGWPVILSHGFPYDVHAFGQVVPTLIDAGARVIRPYCRGFGPTCFLSGDVPRSGQQAARGLDILQLTDALALDRPILGGFDWGGNASCVAAALWPERFSGLVSYAGYDIIDVAGQRAPIDPGLERICWYQHLFQTERGRAGLAADRRGIAALLWREWSPSWSFDDTVFERSAKAFDNPDFVDVVIHCYRWMLATIEGDPSLQEVENRLAGRPAIVIPAVTLDGMRDPLKPGGTAEQSSMFVGPHEHRTVDCGHALPQEAPQAFAKAVLRVRALSGGKSFSC
jgi:pimeloyl-ACP methyl ester carboxylesterase